GLAYYYKGEYDKAISEYTRAIKINPDYALAYNNRGNAYYYKKEYDKAWDDVYKAQSLGYQVNPEFIEDLHKVSEKYL
ncbi:MAG: hypothetical protein COS11_05020, partial [bacterium (Candidatus Ratteibacteria) CG01_land_8_20_14_3_00_40_19]